MNIWLNIDVRNLRPHVAFTSTFDALTRNYSNVCDHGTLSSQKKIDRRYYFLSSNRALRSIVR